MRWFRMAATASAAIVLGWVSGEALAQESSADPDAPTPSGGAGGIVCPPPLGWVPCPPGPGFPTVISYAPSVTFLPTPFGFVPYAPPIVVTSGPAGPWVLSPPVLPPSGILPVPVASPVPVPVPMAVPVPAALPRRQAEAQQGGPAHRVARVAAGRRSATMSDRAVELMTFGDRNFRAGDLRRAENRYRQTMAQAPVSAPPRVRMAQVALMRGRYQEAADWFREATTAEPSWLDRAENVQALYAEPSDFHEALATLEAHLQARPNDRDAWLVLGAQLWLSDRGDRASDVFLRLTDRAPDATLAAFLQASGAGR